MTKSIDRKNIGMVLLVALALASTCVGQSEQSGSGLAGTWRVTVQLQTCDTHAPLGPQFHSYLAFSSGGTMTGTTANPGFAPGQRSNDFGVWSYVGDQNYSAASEAYILFTAGPFVAGTQRISQAVKVAGDQFTAWATVQFLDANHVQVRSACALAQGVRFH